MTLIREGTITAALLILVGVGGYIAGGQASVTALIPAFFGIAILISVLIAKKNLKLGMHLAALFALLGFIVPLGKLIASALRGKLEFTLAAVSQLSMVVICAVFVVLCVKSFIKARGS